MQESVDRMQAWGEARAWSGADPYDALSSPLAPLLTLGTAHGRRLLTQAVKRAPLDLRPVLRIPAARNAKAIGLVASGYARLGQATGDAHARAEAVRWLDWLLANPAPAAGGLAWGYHFDVQTRFFFYPAGSPNTIATAFVAQALLDGVELLGEERFAAPARSVADYLSSTLLVERGDGPFFAYVPGDTQLIHNANALACAVLARASRVAGADGALGVAARALEATLTAQRDDGSWPYAEAARNGWVDNFHTGYLLEALAECSTALPAVAAPLARGAAFWEEELFLEDGRPKYYPDRAFPLDTHCYAQAVDTRLALRRLDATAVLRAERVAQLLVERMLDPRGFAWFQEHRRWTSRTPFVRWTTAPSFRALAHLLLVRAEATAPRGEVVGARLD